jgi:hypothetical protein
MRLAPPPRMVVFDYEFHNHTLVKLDPRQATSLRKPISTDPLLTAEHTKLFKSDIVVA